ncbi:hypothetical protein Y1Q_0017552 [Alligator mississippiensis]|uniref:Uncharacterized protein n=1 Tax=Alligator mississippiensis TaxID=8496 RepID=A0A151P2C6_ALLMI|nr:hypothetical protein Y1Q_0017552 [Alligator mississippiensis]
MQEFPVAEPTSQVPSYGIVHLAIPEDHTGYWNRCKILTASMWRDSASLLIRSKTQDLKREGDALNLETPVIPSKSIKRQPPAASRSVSLWGSAPPPLSSAVSRIVRSPELSRCHMDSSGTNACVSVHKNICKYRIRQIFYIR